MVSWYVRQLFWTENLTHSSAITTLQGHRNFTHYIATPTLVHLFTVIENLSRPRGIPTLLDSIMFDQ
jgi:hypothetical protein